MLLQTLTKNFNADTVVTAIALPILLYRQAKNTPGVIFQRKFNMIKNQNLKPPAPYIIIYSYCAVHFDMGALDWTCMQ